VFAISLTFKFYKQQGDQQRSD